MLGFYLNKIIKIIIDIFTKSCFTKSSWESIAAKSRFRIIIDLLDLDSEK